MLKVKVTELVPKDVKKEWFLVDARDKILGRLATKIANILTGKNKPQYSPQVDVGDYVVVINAEKVKVTGKKLDDKIYYRHSMYPGGLKEVPLRKMLEKFPERVIEHAVKYMLPQNKLRDRRLKKLKVYAGESFPNTAQKPKKIEL